MKGGHIMNFSVNTALLSQQKASFDSLINSIYACSEDVHDVGMNLRWKDLASELFSLKIRRQAAHMKILTWQMRKLRNALSDAVFAYEKSENDITEELRESIKGVTRRENVTNTSGVFDGWGGYGGNQGDMKYNKKKKNFLFWTIRGSQSMYDLVRSYPQYRDYSDDQINALFDQINTEGCGYVAMVNAIFAQYHCDAEAFERDFGFPMHDENGDYNFDRLLLDIYANTDDKYFMDEEYGANALTNEVLSSYRDNEKAFEEEYGVPLYQDGDRTRFNPAAQQAVLDRHKNESVVTQSSDGVNYMTFENRMQHYMKSKGVPMSSHQEKAPSTETVKNYLDQGKSISILDGDGFTLYNEDGSVKQSDMGGHWMTITGVTDDGRYVVSSWGGKYYLKPDELNWQHVEVTDIYV